MTLTLADGPLATNGPATVNYRIDGPPHRLLFTPFPRRVRARFAGRTVLDTVRGRLLHESNLLPVLYVPRADVAEELLRPSTHRTHCPFKGDAAYWSVVVGDRASTDALWGYPQPSAAAPWLADHVAFYWDRVDAWFDEDEQVHGHLRDPYHRVDARRSSRPVRVSVDGELLASSTRPVVLSETGLPTRFYLPPTDVRTDLLVSSTTRTHCPYKGWAQWWSVRIGDRELADVVWGYPDPFADALAAKGYLCIDGESIDTAVDDEARSA